jgi:hypothetical protein
VTENRFLFTDAGGKLIEQSDEGYVYNERGRRSHSVNEEERATKYSL